MLNFRKNNELLFSDQNGNSILFFGLQKLPYNELEYFEVISNGGTSISTFEAVCINQFGTIQSATSLNTAFILYSDGVFYSNAGEVLDLEIDAIYYFKLIDNLGNSYFSEPFQTFEPASFELKQTATAGGSLEIQTFKFHIDNSNLNFGIKEFSIYEMPLIQFFDLDLNGAITGINLYCIDKYGNIQSTTALSTGIASISDDIFTIQRNIYETTLANESLYYFEFITTTLNYYSEYFKTVSTTANNFVITADINEKLLFDIFTTADSITNTWDCSQKK